MVRTDTMMNSAKYNAMIFFFLQEPDMINCNSLRSTSRYSFKDPSGQWHNTDNTYYTIFTEGNVQVTVGVTATNNQNHVSAEASRTITTISFSEQISLYERKD